MKVSAKFDPSATISFDPKKLTKDSKGWVAIHYEDVLAAAHVVNMLLPDEARFVSLVLGGDIKLDRKLGR